MGLIPFLGSSKDGGSESKGRVPQSSSGDLPGRSRRNHRGTTPDGLGDKMKAKDLSFTDGQIHFSVQGTQNSMNVSRSALLKQFRKDASRVSGGIQKVMKVLPREDAKEVKQDIVKTENTDQELLVNAEISGKEKALVAAEILEEVAEQFEQLTDEIFELKADTTDTNFREKKPEFKEKIREAHDTAQSSIELYYLIKENTDPGNSSIESLANDAANLYKNSIKAFSAVCRDAGGEVGLLEEKVGKDSSPDAGRGGSTVFETFFGEPLR